MKAKSFSNEVPLPLDSLAQQNELIPPFIRTIAVRLCWAATADETEAFRLLSAPYESNVLTLEDKQQLCACFPFMISLEAPASIADYTISLVTIWLAIEEMYHRGAVLPEQIMQGLMEKAATVQVHNCREKGNDVVIPEPRY
ncbi:hypothetical protein ACQYRI_03765 [Salmonella enterica]